MGLSRPLLISLAIGLTACGGSVTPEAQLTVFAAASLRDVAADLAVEFERREPVEVVYNFAGSNTLAQQIRAAPGADLFLSADEEWIDFLEQAGRLTGGSRRPFLSNRLVLIARRDSKLPIDAPGDLAGAALRALALADPRAVPAGRYAKAALEGTGGGHLWNDLAGKMAPTLDVRAALALVESDPEIAGVVYRTDALTSDKVRVLYEFPASSPAPIRYWAAVPEGGENSELARRFLDFLTGPQARRIASRYGFGAP